MNLRSLAIYSCLCASALSVTGCGPYTMEDQYRQGIRTVYVPIWTRGRDVYRRDLEFRLTEAIQKRIGSDTPYRLASKEEADTELDGELVRIHQRVLSKNPDTGRAREMEETFYIDFTWKDLRTGEILVERRNFNAAATYIPVEPFEEDFFHGSQDVINRLARRIVETMEADW
jgi:hypothetical protein